jgi:hypothetical protein
VPITERIPEGRTVQLPCVPPDADPKAEVSFFIMCKKFNNFLDILAKKWCGTAA